MTHVIVPTPGRRAGTLTAPRAVAKPSTTHNTEAQAIARQAAIENALSTALYFVRQPGDAAAHLWAATARANRALSLLKQASQDIPATPAKG